VAETGAETEGADRRRRRAGGEEPSSPSEVSAPSWRAAVTEAVKRHAADDGLDRAAALTYYAVLSLFPGLLVLVALLGVLGEHPRTTDALLEIVADLGPEEAVETFRGPVENVTAARGGAAALLGIGLLGAVWAASGYLGAFSRASNAIYGVEEGRPFWKLRPQQIGMTILMVLLLALVAIGVVVSGPLAEAIGSVIGLGDTAVTVWMIAKWPVLLLIVAFMIAVLYYWAPNIRQSRFRWITPGSLLAVLVWIAASSAFAVYVANFGSYGATYGSLGGVIVFLLWLWLGNNAILLGQQLNSQLERRRELEQGVAGDTGSLKRVPREPAD
jgi:membrane protein